ncbi:hypothetical protein DSO06_05185 [Candidatus Nezhaarchaeota archaeon WYZ-LMO8]|nr:MAG: hypothetical protein DSO06_05185 [Candidatus Nezhaarchaeota archaeon WYZ-LMO8]TDA36001.1 MAG: hypothetical protein DSO05_04320 [Candidatus Nezhaarchaeota archaeon WYZ-LMO7]
MFLEAANISKPSFPLLSLRFLVNREIATYNLCPFCLFHYFSALEKEKSAKKNIDSTVRDVNL